MFYQLILLFRNSKLKDLVRVQFDFVNVIMQYADTLCSLSIDKLYTHIPTCTCNTILNRIPKCEKMQKLLSGPFSHPLEFTYTYFTTLPKFWYFRISLFIYFIDGRGLLTDFTKWWLKCGLFQIFWTKNQLCIHIILNRIFEIPPYVKSTCTRYLNM